MDEEEMSRGRTGVYRALGLPHAPRYRRGLLQAPFLIPRLAEAPVAV